MAFLDETGLAHLWSKTTNKFLAKANVANNLTTTSEGYALDARQGVALMNAISGSNMKLVPEILINKPHSRNTDPVDKTYTFEHNCILSITVTPGGRSHSVDVYINDIKHTLPGNDSDAVNFQAFIPKGTAVRIFCPVNGSDRVFEVNLLATVLYIE